MSRPFCKACGKDIPYAYPDGMVEEHCRYCGHPYGCSGCGACQHCPKCGDDRHKGECKKTKLPRADVVTYLEMARIALDRDDVRDQIADALDLSDSEISRLSKQLNKYLEKGS